MRFSPENNASSASASDATEGRRAVFLAAALRAVLDSDSNLKVFNVNRNSDGTCLNTNYASPENQFNLGSRWVVCRSAATLFISPRPLVPGSFVLWPPPA